MRCACRHCRFKKCKAVGMDPRGIYEVYIYRYIFFVSRENCTIQEMYIICFTAIQNDRDRIGPTKKCRMNSKRNSSADEDQLSLASLSPPHPQHLQHSQHSTNPSALMDEKMVECLIQTEEQCNLLRKCIMVECKGVKDTLLLPSLLYQATALPIDVSQKKEKNNLNLFKGQDPAKRTLSCLSQRHPNVEHSRTEVVPRVGKNIRRV